MDWYCELMGVENVADLPQNYTNEDSENKGENDNIVQTNACIIKGKDIKTRGRIDGIYTNSSSLSPLHTTFPYSMEGFTNEEIQQCNSYKLDLHASANRTHH